MIVILALVAAFLGLRLYSVLGKRTGHEQLPAATGQAEDRPVVPQMSTRAGQPTTPEARAANPLVLSGAEAGVRDIIAADRSFDVPQFIEGARSAYGMILDAYWRGNSEDLRWLCDADVASSFETAVVAREEAGHVLENRLVRIDSSQIVDASLQGRVAHVTVQFDADIAAITRDGNGAVVAGSLTDAVPTHDLWTFSRDTSQSDPNWKLSATDEAA